LPPTSLKETLSIKLVTEFIFPVITDLIFQSQGSVTIRLQEYWRRKRVNCKKVFRRVMAEKLCQNGKKPHPCTL